MMVAERRYQRTQTETHLMSMDDMAQLVIQYRETFAASNSSVKIISGSGMIVELAITPCTFSRPPLVGT